MPVFDLDTFLYDANGPVDLSPDGPTVWVPPADPNLGPALSPAAIVDLSGPLPDGLLESLGHSGMATQVWPR